MTSRRHPPAAQPTTLWGGPLDGKTIRVHPAVTHVEEADLLGRIVLYTRRGDRLEYTPPTTTSKEQP